jgi:ribonucleoside-diphosphate reductase alpha chain
VPVESIVNKFAHQRFEPMGMTTNQDIPFAKSLVDYIFRWLGMQFIEGFREQNAPKRSKPAELTAGDAGTAGAGSASAHAPANGKEAAWPERNAGHTHGASMGAPSAADRTRGADARAKDDAASILHGRSVTDVVAASIIDGSDGASSRMEVKQVVTVTEVHGSSSALNQSNAQLMGDAPPCSTCGEITVRNGTCYRCLNCGTSMGCS